MPALEVQFYSNDGVWQNSEASGRYDSFDDLVNHLEAHGAGRPRRARFVGDDCWHPVAFAQDPNPDHALVHCDQPGLVPIYSPPPTPERIDPIMSTEPSNPNALVDIAIKRNPEGKLVLAINAAPLHALLDSVGCKFDAAGIYQDQPSVGFAVISSGKLSTRLFLSKQYPMQVALAQHYTRPPSYGELKTLCESGHECVKTILAHYQPVDIHYTINKLVRETREAA